MIDWDFFIAYASADVNVAKRLYDALSLNSRVFLDSQYLIPGVEWDKEIPIAQRKSLVTVVLVSSNTEQAYYQRAEIAAAINMARKDEGKHRVIPVLLGRKPDDQLDVPLPYGLPLKQGLFAPNINDLSVVTESLLKSLRQFKRASPEQYGLLLDFEGYKVPYIPLINDCRDHVNNFSLNNLKIQCEDVKYKLPEEFMATKVASEFQNNPSCRLSSYRLINENELSITLSETSYEDYLKSGEHLDDPLPNDKTKTFRDAFGSLIREGRTNLRPFNLTNICGAGIFIISSDGHIVITKHSEQSHVYPGRMTFSASGTMKWGAYPHPFNEIMRKCFEEARHQINLAKLQLIGFGVDARKLYFQFGFYERTGEKITDVVGRYSSNAKYEAIPFELEPLIDQLVNRCWEPAAEAALLTMCVSEFGHAKVSKALLSNRQSWDKRNMKDEWDYRASRAHLLPDMSVRYPPNQLEQESEKYVDAILRFMGDDVNKKDIVEIGSGTGRITERLVKRARSITCVDLCERMIQRNRERLGSGAINVNYINKFAQEYNPQQQFDVAICSLVLIHNVNDSDFDGLVRVMCEHANLVYVFEDITESRATSPYTRLRTINEIKAAFEVNGYQEDPSKQSEQYQLFEDRIRFFKFYRPQMEFNDRMVSAKSSRDLSWVRE